MDADRMNGTRHQVLGALIEAAGDVWGIAEQAAGKFPLALGDMKRSAGDALNKT